MAVLTILVSLAVVSVRSSLPKARDNERQADTSGIASQIESYARTRTSAVPAAGQGSYIPTSALSTNAETFAASNLPDIDRTLLFAPGVDKTEPMSLVSATNNNTSPTGVRPKPTINTYVYQPLKNDNTLCVNTSDSCAKFYIYYMRENPSDDCAGSPKTICTVKASRL